MMAALLAEAQLTAMADVQLLGVSNGFPQLARRGSAGAARRRLREGAPARGFRLHVAELATLGVAKVAEVVLRYVTVGEQVAMVETRVPLTVNLVSADKPPPRRPTTKSPRRS